jgi:hypothetical protein
MMTVSGDVQGDNWSKDLCLQPLTYPEQAIFCRLPCGNVLGAVSTGSGEMVSKLLGSDVLAWTDMG